jgi:Na+/melibiose symporter-like transporter
MVKGKKENPDKVGAVKFLAWQTRGVSAAANFIVVSYVTIYCTDMLQMSPALVGTLLFITKIADGVTDLFAGYIIDRTNSRLGKGRPYELAILGAWLCTWLLFSTPVDASMVAKCIWVALMYSLISAVFVTLLGACQTPYMVRAFKTNGQLVKIATLGGIAIMVGASILHISFPVLMNRIAVSPAGWSKLVGLLAFPLGLLGIVRFLVVKETVKVEAEKPGEKIHFKDVGAMLAHNPNFFIIAFVWLVSSVVNGMGIHQYFFSYVVGNIELMGTASIFSLVVMPLMFLFPPLLKRISYQQAILAGCAAYIIGGILFFVANKNIPLIMVGALFSGLGSMPLIYLPQLMVLECGSYNTWKGRKRMDGILSAVVNFSGKVGGGLGSALLGFLLSMGGYNGALETQSDFTVLVIRILMGGVPAVLFLLAGITMLFYNLDKLMPQIKKSLEAQTAAPDPAKETF